MPAPPDSGPLDVGSVRLVRLTDGETVASAAPLFLFPGAGGRAEELAGLAARLPAGREVFAVEAYDAGGTVDDMAARAIAAIRGVQPAGPCDLAGYSFGGLVALEVAGLLRETGQGVGALTLIETFFDARYWPIGVFALAQARRTAIQLSAAARKPLTEAAATLALRARRLGARLAARLGRRDHASARGESAGAGDVQTLCLAAMAAYAPRPYPGRVTLLRAARNADFGCDCADLWAPFLPNVAPRSLPGDHLGVVRDADALDAAAAALAEPTPLAPEPPTALVVTTARWMATARLALSLSEAGFAVEAVCPDRHPMLTLPFVRRRGGAGSGLRAAIIAARPAMVIPADDRAAQQLHSLWGEAGATARGQVVRRALARSLGDPQAYGALHDRAAILARARTLDVPHAETAAVPTPEAATAWLERAGGSAMLKTDASWGGQGVIEVQNREEAVRAWRRLADPPGLARTLKRWLVNGDASLLERRLRGVPPAISIQRHVTGRPGTASLVCRDGVVLAAVCCDVLRTAYPTGPATVVRVLDHPQMLETARRLVGSLNLSGFCGLDFMLDAETGEARLIELNPRATPTAHLVTADGRTLAQVLFAAVVGRAETRPAPRPANDVVALFPQERARDPASPFLASARDDTPWQAPDLVAMAEADLKLGGKGRRASGLRRAVRWSPQSG